MGSPDLQFFEAAGKDVLNSSGQSFHELIKRFAAMQLWPALIIRALPPS